MCGGVSCDTVIMENSSDNGDDEDQKSFAMEEFDMVKTVGTGEELLIIHVNSILCRHICQSMHMSKHYSLQAHLPKYACVYTNPPLNILQ